MVRIAWVILCAVILAPACTSAEHGTAIADSILATTSPTSNSPVPSTTPVPTLAASTATFTPLPSPQPTAASMEASVAVDLLSCRYGPDPAYLFLYALRGGANIKLIGRTDGDNWNWAYVEGQNGCWVNVSFLRVDGDWRRLPVVYPGIASLPITPYYPPTAVTKATRSGSAVTVQWLEIPLRLGDEEDQAMQHYIVEIWRCDSAEIRFEPIATNSSNVVFTDEPGCSEPSHGRVFVQEKHGFAGPAEIPWPPVE